MVHRQIVLRRSRRSACAAALVFSMLLWRGEADAAAFMQTALGVQSTALLNNRTYSYFVGPAPAGGYPAGFTANTLTNGTLWITTPTSPAPAGAGDLEVDVTHSAAAGFGPGTLIPLVFPSVSFFGGLIGVYGQAAQVGHGAGMDVARASVVRMPGAEPPASGRIVVSASHVLPGAPMGLKWSLTNGATGPLNYRVTPSYRANGGATFRGPCAAGTAAVGADCTTIMPTLASGATTSANPLPPTATVGGVTGTLSDYTIRGLGSPQSDTTLAFVGDVDGQVNELDLNSAALLFTDTGVFDVPDFDASDQPIYVAVDLTTWLSAASSFMPAIGDTFSITDGSSPQLPGFEFSTAPIDFVPGQGFNDTAPLTDVVSVRAMIDGETEVPEPVGLALFGAALAGMATVRVARRRG